MVGVKNDKAWYESKTVWGGLLFILAAIYQMWQLGGLDIQALTQLATGLGIIGIRDRL